MTTIAFFNNKGGVGKTTLVYHLSFMFARLGVNTLAVDLDPQANLTAAFLDENVLETLWQLDAASRPTVLFAVQPILKGTGDIEEPVPLALNTNLSLLAGDLGLSRFEDRLSEAWPRGYQNDPQALRTTSAFHRTIQIAGGKSGAQVALIDVGPNLGAINRAALLASDFIVVPLAADLFSLQGLRNLGPTVRQWRTQWTLVRKLASTEFPLPVGSMQPAGYVVLQHAVRLDRPVKAYSKWLERIPGVYRTDVLGETQDDLLEQDHCLATLRNYRSLMPMAQEARKPIFDLTPADGAIGSHAQLVRTCEDEFRLLAQSIAQACGVEL